MNQLNFFDASGAPHADMHCGMTLDKYAPSRATLAGMKFIFIPTIRADWAFIALETLRQIHIDKSQPWVHSDWIDEPIEVEYWAATVFVVFRKDSSDDDGTIRLTRLKDQFHMSLPSVGAWSDFGLSWVYSHTSCRKEKQNPTPWLGRICDCERTEPPKMPPKHIPQWP